MSSPTVPIFDPQGVLRDIPYEQMKDAVKAGGKPGVKFESPDGKTRYVPADQTQDAVKAGGKLLPIQQQDHGIPELYGFTPGHLLSNAWEGVKSAVEGAGAVVKDLASNPNWVQGDTSTLHKFVETPMQAEAAKAVQASDQGHKVEAAGHALASGVPLVGPWAASIGEQAGTGDVGGAVAKTAAQVATPIAASKVLDLAKTGAAKAVLLGKTPAEAYQSALKPSTTIPPAKVADIVQTGLNNKIPVSQSGVDKLGSLLDDFQNKVTAEIKARPGRTVDPNAVASRADQIKGKFANQVNPTADLNAIADSKQEFLDNNKQPIPAADAQSMKVGTYQQLKGKAYGELKTASVESQKALARGLKEELENAFPELHDLNAGGSKLYDLKPVLEKAIQRQANHQLLGIGTPIATGAAKAVTGSNAAAAVTGALKAVVDNPIVKSRLAIYLNKSGVPWSTATARVQAYSGALAGAASVSNSETPDGPTK